MEHLIPFILFSFAMIITPGPNNIMLMNSGLNFGVQKSLPHYLGVCLGFPLMFLVVAFGFAAIFEKYFWIKEVLRIVGAFYMLYIAYVMVTAYHAPKNTAKGKPFTFMQALIIQWVNPKAWVVAISTISIYTLLPNYFYSAILMGIIFFIVCIPCSALWLLLGKKLKSFLKSELHYRVFNISVVALLVASITMTFFE